MSSCTAVYHPVYVNHPSHLVRPLISMQLFRPRPPAFGKRPSASKLTPSFCPECPASSSVPGPKVGFRQSAGPSVAHARRTRLPTKGYREPWMNPPPQESSRCGRRKVTAECDAPAGGLLPRVLGATVHPPGHPSWLRAEKTAPQFGRKPELMWGGVLARSSAEQRSWAVRRPN